MKGNQRVKLVDPDCDDEREIKRDFLKVKILETYNEYIDKNCTSSGDIRNKSVTNPIKPLNTVKDRVKSKELMIVDTDTTNRLSVMKGFSFPTHQ